MTRVQVPHLLALAGLPALALATAPAPAEAAGIERAIPSARVLFREGNWAEFGVTHIRPRLRGEDADLAPLNVAFQPEGRTSDIFDSYTLYSFTLKGDLTERASYAIIIDQPWGARTTYREDDFTGGFSYEGTIARIDSRALTTILAYDVTPQVKVFGGLRAQRTEANAAIPFVEGYTIETNQDWSLGWLAGAGFQIPEIALNVSLTYYSRVRHDFETTETSNLGTLDGETRVETPQAVNLEFQSGVAADTLVFGSVRWVDWSDFVIPPPLYETLTGGALVTYPGDWWTYTLGVGRRFTDTWSGAIQASYEPSIGGTQTTLGPVDGRTILGAGLTYSVAGAEITGTLAYGWLGDARNVIDTQFEDGRFTAIGLRIGTTF